MKESFLDYHYTVMSPDTEWLFVTPSLDSRDLQLHVQEIGRIIYARGHYTRRGSLESYQISYQLTDTKGTMLIDGKEYSFPKKGEVMFLDCTKGYYMETEGFGDSYFVHFWSPSIAYYCNLFKSMNNGELLFHGNSEIVQKNILKLMEIYRCPNTREDDIRAEILVMEMVMDLIKMVTHQSRHTHSDYVEHALKVIQDHYAENISLDILAERVHVSKYYLSHIFKKELGMTLANYIRKFRIEKAKELLINTNFSQEAICDKVGLYNGSHMSKLFRIYEGITPDQYRKKWAKQ